MKKSTSIVIFILGFSLLFFGVMRTIGVNTNNDPIPTITLPAQPAELEEDDDDFDDD